MANQSNFSLASWKKKENTEKEKRAHERKLIPGAEATVFTSGIVTLNARVEDTSPAGAGLVNKEVSSNVKTDTQLTVSIQSGQHKVTRLAIVRWVIASHDAMRYGLEYIDHVRLEPDTHKLDIELVRIDPVCALRIPAGIAVRRKVLPFLEMNGHVHIAASNIKNLGMINAIERLVKAPIVLWEVDPDKLDRVLKQVYGNVLAVKTLPGNNQGNEAVDLGDKLLYAAYIRQASDIHIDPNFQGARIRFRVDGQLETYDVIKYNIYSELASRLKVMSNLDIAEKRLPQDGRFSHQFVSGGRRIDVRVATLPTKYGERITLRLLALQTGNLTLDRLGFRETHRNQVENFLRRIQGMMILTGPTGSGKTTTLYAAIRMMLEERHVNVITIEDPIEYEIEGVAQCEVDPTSTKVDFAKALRSILRHDPDIVMLGEIRDKETASIAIKAALTGHLVLGTLHTNSAAATVTRLIDMGIEPYLVAAALRLAVAQRLMRRLCSYCRIPRPLTELEAIAINRKDLSGREIHDPTGCIYCANKGFSGRIGLYEILEMKSDWARNIVEGGGETELVSVMRESGIQSLLDDAIEKMLIGETSYSEVLQVASSW